VLINPTVTCGHSRTWSRKCYQPNWFREKNIPHVALAILVWQFLLGFSPKHDGL